MRHRFHAMCPYFAMFPETFVQRYLVWTKPGDIVFDPFSGRGTTVFESLLQGRQAYGCDVNNVAICISNAKANPPTRPKLYDRLDELRALFKETKVAISADRFFSACFSQDTLRQLTFLRSNLNWKRNKTDRFIAALVLGSLHGESHRSARYFSNQMPRTISTKPDYSVRWWDERKMLPPMRDVFSVLSEMVDYRFESEPPTVRGVVKHSDARKAINAFPQFEGKISMVITSPPYLDTTNFEEDQWLRLWFLGGPEHPNVRLNGDDRHLAEEKYWEFLTEAWAGVGPLLKKNAHLVVRIGGKR
ncbi:MAG: methylase, partial [Verrucomicrobiales bacterium]|nr:methylase [Verrucomicrobiales bacterium]